MKTTVHKFWKKRSILLLTLAFTAIFALTSVQSDAQELKSRFAQAQNLIESMDVNSLDTSYTFTWNEDSSRWELYNRELELYESNQKLLAVINQRYNKEKNAWEKYDRTIKTYDEKGNLIENLHQEYNPNLDKWINLKVKTIAYNSKGEKQEVLYHEWRQALEKWISTVRYLITYNRNGDESNVLIKTFDPARNQWNKSLRYSFTYEDGLSDPSETLVERWNPFAEKWENRGKYLLSYDFRGNRTKEVHVTWNEAMRQWINGIEYSRKYSKNLLLSEMQRRWDYREKEWTNAILDVFNYDENGDLTKLVEKRWNADSSQWIVKNQYLYSEVLDIDLKKNQ